MKRLWTGGFVLYFSCKTRSATHRLRGEGRGGLWPVPEHVVPDLSPGVRLTTLSTVYRNNYLCRFCTTVCWAVWPSNIVVVNHCQIDKTQDTFLLCKRLCFNPIQSPDAAMELVWKVIKGKLIWRRFFFGKFGAGCELWRGVHTDHHHQVWVSSKHTFALLLPKVVWPGVFPIKLRKVAAG